MTHHGSTDTMTQLQRDESHSLPEALSHEADESHSHTVTDTPYISPLHCYTVTLPQVVNDEPPCSNLSQINSLSPNSTQQAHITSSQHWRPRHNDTDHVSSDTSDTPEHSQIAEDASDASDASDAIYNFRLDLLPAVPEVRGQRSPDPSASATSSSSEDPTNPERLRSVVSLCSSNLSNVPLTSAASSQVIPLTSRTELGVSSNSLTCAPDTHRNPIPTITCNSCRSSTQHRVQRHRHYTYTDRHSHLQVLKRRGCKKHAFWSQVLDGGYKLVSGSPGTLETMGTPAFLMTECPCTFKL